MTDSTHDATVDWNEFWYEADDDDRDEHAPGGVDPDRFEERFSLVLDRESILSYSQIRDALGTWPRSFWEVTEKPEQRWTWDHAPLVWVPK